MHSEDWSAQKAVGSINPKVLAPSDALREKVVASKFSAT